MCEGKGCICLKDEVSLSDELRLSVCYKKTVQTAEIQRSTFTGFDTSGT